MDINETWQEQLPAGVREFALNNFKFELDSLYYPDLYVLPLTPEGEQEREYLINELTIFRYGAHEVLFQFEGDTFLAILVNND
jgi:hypothetical protein